MVAHPGTGTKLSRLLDTCTFYRAYSAYNAKKKKEKRIANWELSHD